MSGDRDDVSTEHLLHSLAQGEVSPEVAAATALTVEVRQLRAERTTPAPVGAAVALDLRSHESLLVAAYALRGASSLADDDDTAQWLETLAQQFEDDAAHTPPTRVEAVALDLDAIEKREKAATPGPWSAADEHGLLGPDAHPAWCISRMRPGHEPMTPTDGYMHDVAEIVHDGPMEADAEFIAHARGDVPALVAEVRRLTRWQFEALPVMVGLQDLGSALGMRLGESITGHVAVEAARALTARAEAAEAEVVTLRARLARSQSRHCGCGWCCSNNADGVIPGDAHLICSRYRAAIETGEGQ